MLSETIHMAGRPVGRLLVNTNSQEISFQPHDTPSPVPDRDWESVDELRNAIARAYSEPEKDESPSG